MDLSALTDDELEAYRAELADARTKIRHQQNEVEAELDLRRALSLMGPESRRIVKIRLEGVVASAGSAVTE